jgi:hypothetical protein
VRAPFLLGIVEVIAIPCLTRFFGARLLHFGACATAKARHDEEGEKPGNFQAGECVFHFFLLSLKMAQRRNPRLSNEGAAYNTTPFQPSQGTENRDDPLENVDKPDTRQTS